MEDLKNRFKMSPIYTVPDVPEYLLWDRAMALNEMFDWSDGKLHAQKPYRHQEMDPLNAKKFVTFQFLGPIRTTNFKMHPSWEKAKVVVRIWVAWTDYENEIISGKWHLLYELSYSKEKDSFGNYKECPELINTIRIEINGRYLIYIGNMFYLFSPLSNVEFRNKFHLFSPLKMKVLYGFYELQTWTYHVSVPAKQPDIKSNGRNFTETLLTPQVLYDIFARLDLCSLSRCAQVNRRWNSIASDLHFYRDVDLKMYWNKINGKTLEKLKEKLQKVRKLDLAWCNEYLMGGDAFNNSIASILETVKDTLTHLSLNSTRWLTKLTIQRIFNCPNLEELRLRNHDFRLINNFSLSCCGNRTTRLTTLDISMSFIEDEHLIKILETIPNLEHLVMDNCEHLRNLERILTTTGTHNLKLKSWSSPLTFCKKNYSIIYAKFGKLIHLEYLNLSFSEPREPYITNCFESIAMNCQKLKRLELMNWDKVTDEELLPIITQCKQLLHLNLTATNISFVTLAVACENLPDLQDICITLCDDINIEMIEHYTETYPKVNFYQEKLYPPKYR